LHSVSLDFSQSYSRFKSIKPLFYKAVLSPSEFEGDGFSLYKVFNLGFDEQYKRKKQLQMLSGI